MIGEYMEYESSHYLRRDGIWYFYSGAQVNLKWLIKKLDAEYLRQFKSK